MNDSPTMLTKSSTTPLTAQAPVIHMTVLFQAGEANLPDTEVEVLKNWVRCWPSRGSRNVVELGGACESSRTGRLRRLNSILELFAQLGVPSKNVREDEEWTKPSRMGALDDLPADAVWLKLIQSPSDRKSVALEALGASSQARQNKEQSCTSEF